MTTLQTETPQVEAEKTVSQVIQQESTPWVKYAVYGVIVAVILVLAYYAYSAFVENSEQEPENKDKDVPIMDYNLAEAIQELEAIQSKILKKVSSAVDI